MFIEQVEELLFQLAVACLRQAFQLCRPILTAGPDRHSRGGEPPEQVDDAVAGQGVGGPTGCYRTAGSRSKPVRSPRLHAVRGARSSPVSGSKCENLQCFSRRQGELTVFGGEAAQHASAAFGGLEEQ